MINQNTQMSQRMNDQWRAIGTTIRYAVAGTAVFGLQRLVQQVAAVNQQLGQMQALSDIGTSGGGFSNAQITQLGNRLQQTAINTITPLNDVNEAAINFLSTVQNVKPSDLPAMLQQIGQGAKLAQTPMEDLTQAATTMQIAFGRAVNPTTVGQFTRMWETLIGIAPGGISAAPTIAQSMPGLASMFQLAPGRAVPPNVAQAQMMALTLGITRTGMPAATGMRGLTYLLQSVAQPTGGAKNALAAIGVTPELVQQQGIFAAVMKVLQAISPVSTTERNRLGQIPDDTLDQLDQTGGNLPGIPASEMSRLRAMIPRIHGIRAAIILASQLQQHGDVMSIAQDLNRMLQAQDQNSQASQQLSKAWQDLAKRSKLQQASIAVNQIGLSIANNLVSPLNFIAGKLTGLGSGIVGHRAATKIGTISAGGFLAAMGIGRLTGIGAKLPGPLGKIFGGSIGSAFVAERAIQAATGPNAGVLGGSPENPLYVTVVGQIFGGYTGGGVGTGTKILKTAEEDAKDVATGGFLSKIFKGPLVRTVGKLGITRAALGVGGLAAAGLTEAAAIPLLLGGDQPSSTMTVLKRAQQLFGRNVTNVAAISEQKVKGRADVYLTLEQKDSTGKITRRKVHIPVDLWQGGRHPSTRGQPGKGTRSH